MSRSSETEVTAQTNPREHSVVYRYRVEFDKVIDADDPAADRAVYSSLTLYVPDRQR